MADTENYEELYTISANELTLMKGIYKQPPKFKKAKNTPRIFAISEGHSSRLAMRYVSLCGITKIN
jgi:hypothetical protein